MAKYIIELTDTADGGIDIEYIERNAIEGSIAIEIGRLLSFRIDALVAECEAED